MHNIACSFKVLVGLVFSAMEHDTHELFCCLAWTATTGKQIVLHKTIKCFQSSWRFLKLYMYIQIKTFMHAVTSHKMERAKYHTEKP